LGYAAGVEVFAEEGLATTAEEAVIALGLMIAIVMGAGINRLVNAAVSQDRQKKLTVMPTSATQRSPSAKPLTFFPIWTTLPMASWPGMSWCCC